ncbi:hypothetical protein [Pseudoscardovia suis]|uniref:DUF2530 domain-containing protein n=1 Tax=Pseudoscardovia suis TaxID=987063 RepID=A0A261EWA5_9BIFI|nr:hypothetical protein [Pseudoscardovia suis]OZG51131.1 hypothetical protein PSSU_1068 [Pseudoscardovia suis]PJJ65923.1 hypothetical protein CLV65_1171 [Pseudoscardovia suis]
MKLAPIWDPTARKPGPPPVHVDLFPLFLGGTVLWGVAGVVCIICNIAGIMPLRETITCVIGVVVGLGLLIWEHNERRIYRLLGDDDDSATDASDDAGVDSATAVTSAAGDSAANDSSVDSAVNSTSINNAHDARSTGNARR